MTGISSLCLQSLWSESMELSKQRVQEPASPHTSLDTLRFAASEDCRSGVQRAVRKRMEQELYSAALPLESRAVHDEAKLYRIASALESTYRCERHGCSGFHQRVIVMLLCWVS